MKSSYIVDDNYATLRPNLPKSVTPSVPGVNGSFSIQYTERLQKKPIKIPYNFISQLVKKNGMTARA